MAAQNEFIQGGIQQELSVRSLLRGIYFPFHSHELNVAFGAIAQRKPYSCVG